MNEIAGIIDVAKLHALEKESLEQSSRLDIIEIETKKDHARLSKFLDAFEDFIIMVSGGYSKKTGNHVDGFMREIKDNVNDVNSNMKTMKEDMKKIAELKAFCDEKQKELKDKKKENKKETKGWLRDLATAAVGGATGFLGAHLLK